VVGSAQAFKGSAFYHFASPIHRSEISHRL
jgi:hypothetical protein